MLYDGLEDCYESTGLVDWNKLRLIRVVGRCISSWRKWSEEHVRQQLDALRQVQIANNYELSTRIKKGHVQYNDNRWFSHDVLVQIMSYLDHRELLSVCRVSKEWYLISASDFIWNQFLSGSNGVRLTSDAKWVFLRSLFKIEASDEWKDHNSLQLQQVSDSCYVTTLHKLGYLGVIIPVVFSVFTSRYQHDLRSNNYSLGSVLLFLSVLGTVGRWCTWNCYFDQQARHKRTLERLPVACIYLTANLSSVFASCTIRHRKM